MRKCLRTIDKPLLLFGLEPEDVGNTGFSLRRYANFLRCLLRGPGLLWGLDVFKVNKTR